MEILLAILAGALLFGGSSKTVVIHEAPKLPPRPLTKSEREERERLSKIPVYWEAHPSPNY